MLMCRTVIPAWGRDIAPHACPSSRHLDDDHAKGACEVRLCSAAAEKLWRLFDRDFAPGGAVEIFVKDMGLAIDLAQAHGIELQIVPAARRMFDRAEAAGWGKDDASRVIEVYEGKDRARYKSDRRRQ